MLSPADLSCLLVYIITFSTGLLGNGCILAMNVMHRIRGTLLTGCDLIVSILSVSNICVQCAFLAGHLCSMIDMGFFQKKAVQYFLTMNCTFQSISLWSSAWLCVYYCVKIVNCNRPLFLQAKTNFPKMAPWLLLCSFVVSVAISLPRLWDFYRAPMASTAINVSLNIVPSNRMTDSSSVVLFLIHIAVSSLAFTGMLLSATMIITSLCRHMKTMEASADGFRNPNLDVHLGAVKTISSLLALYVLFYLCHSFLILRVVKRGEKAYMVCTCVISVFPTLVSIILIMGSSRLKQGMAEGMLCVKGCFNKTPDTERPITMVAGQ